ncbi:four helix bundle protein [Chloroflexi bacterium TSY]|nr:four helix bundle protein [Chloroflexi bacterium TSY]
MASITRFEDIQGWKMARQLTNLVYSLSNKQPFGRDFGLKDQIRRASGSIMHNIAEGFDAGSDPEFIRFLRYALRSATEVQSQLYIAKDQNYITQDEFQELYNLANQTKNTINGFIRYLSLTNKQSKT